MAKGEKRSGGGFFRGLLVGLLVSVVLFIGLAAFIPLNQGDAVEVVAINVDENTSEPAEVVEATPAPAPVETSEEVENEPDINTTASIPVPTPVLSPTPTIDALPTNGTEVEEEEEEEEEPEVVEETNIASNPTTSGTSNTLEMSGQTIIATEEAATEPAETTSTLELAGQTIIAPESTAQGTTTGVDNSIPALIREAQQFNEVLNKPLLSIILLAETSEQAQAIINMGVPVTMAVSADNPSASLIIAAYRINGGEALLVIPTVGDAALRSGGEVGEVHQRISGILSASQNVIGIIDGPGGDLNQDGAMLGAVVSELKQSGHAIVTMAGIGLNRADILAAENGVPSISIAGTLNIDSGKVAVIRDLDRAALQLVGANTVVVYGSATPDTISAIGFWMKSLKAKSVIVAPVSTAINNQ